MPLSYLEGLASLARSAQFLSLDEQIRLLREVEPGLAARDEAERAGAWKVLDLLERRESTDLFSASKDRIVAIRGKYSNLPGNSAYSAPGPPRVPERAPEPASRTSEPSSQNPSRSAEHHATPPPSPAARCGGDCSKYAIGAVAAVATIVFLLVLAASCSDPYYYYYY